jgi:hypothetical protein
MSNGLYYEDTHTKVPHELILLKSKQLRAGFSQFSSLKSSHSSGLFILYKWSFTQSKQANRSGHIFFIIELLNLANAESLYRVWEMKDNHLLNDSKLGSANPYIKSGYLYADWWQELKNKGLSLSDNKSLKRACEAGIEETSIQYLQYIVSDGSVRIRPIGGEKVRVEYKMWLESGFEEKIQTLKIHVDMSRHLEVVEVIEKGTENVLKLKNQLLTLKE